jgi:GT2 family glycosyltransferase
MNKPPYSLVIATFERPEPLAETLASLEKQTHPPAQVIIVDASKDERTREVAANFEKRLPVIYERASAPSAALQRNQGARLATSALTGFLDDDTTLCADVFEKLCDVFAADAEKKIGGVAARIAGMRHKPPRGLLWFYYRLQAGYSHPTYGGKLFGPVINCIPSYDAADGDLIPGEWLNSTCVLYRTQVFLNELFPKFEGYSFMEDVHLSARIAKTHRLFFHATAEFEHHDATSSFKRDARWMARMRIRNQRAVARDVMNLAGPIFEAKLLLHKLFVTVSILRWQKSARWDAIAGTWLP